MYIKVYISMQLESGVLLCNEDITIIYIYRFVSVDFLLGQITSAYLFLLLTVWMFRVIMTLWMLTDLSDVMHSDFRSITDSGKRNSCVY